jgi:hypothetical protein
MSLLFLTIKYNWADFIVSSKGLSMTVGIQGLVVCHEVRVQMSEDEAE